MKGEWLYKISILMGNSPEICRRHFAALAPEALEDNVEFCNKGGSITEAPTADFAFECDLSRARGTDIFGA